MPKIIFYISYQQKHVQLYLLPLRLWSVAQHSACSLARASSGCPPVSHESAPCWVESQSRCQCLEPFLLLSWQRVQHCLQLHVSTHKGHCLGWYFIKEKWRYKPSCSTLGSPPPIQRSKNRLIRRLHSNLYPSLGGISNYKI